jgi:hypothetical protein
LDRRLAPESLSEGCDELAHSLHAFPIVSSAQANVNLMWLSPGVPNSHPGMTTTCFSASSPSAKSTLFLMAFPPGVVFP